MRTRISLLVMTTVCSTSATALAQCQYEVLVYPSAECVFWSDRPYSGLGLNNLGGWAGYRWDCPGNTYLPIYCPAGGTPQVLPMPPGAGPKGAWAYGVNDAGVIAGVSYEGPNGEVEKGAVWWPDGSVTIIPPSDGTYSPAYAINNLGMVVGANQGKPYVWHEGVMTIIDPLTLGYGYAWSVSDAGYVTGTLGNQNSNGRAFRWRDGAIDLLEPVGGHSASVGYGVNSLGWVVGMSRTVIGSQFFYTPTLWTPAVAFELSAPPGYSRGWASRVNDAGIIIGFFNSAGPELPARAVIWVAGEPFLANDLVVPGSPSIGSVAAINSVGQILSGGSAKLLTPIGASPADLNGDCAVNGADLALILSEWGPVLQPGSGCDINGDGTVDGADLGLLLSAWSP